MVSCAVLFRVHAVRYLGTSRGQFGNEEQNRLAQALDAADVQQLASSVIKEHRQPLSVFLDGWTVFLDRGLVPR